MIERVARLFQSCLMRTGLACLVALSPCLVKPAHAGRIELSGGRSWTLTPRLYTDAEFLEWIGDARPIWRLRWSPAFSLGHFGARDNLGDIRLDNAVWVGAAGARLFLWRDAFLGFQVATTKGKTDALSGAVEFSSTLGWQGDHWQFMVRHISDAALHKPNHGETMFLVGIAF